MADTLPPAIFTSITRLTAKLDFCKQHSAWISAFTTAAAASPGHAGTELFETITPDKQPLFTFIIHFHTLENLAQWKGAATRENLMNGGKAFFMETEPSLRLPGVDYWYENKRLGTGRLAPKWKMLLIMIVIIFTLLNTLIPLLQVLSKPLSLPPLLNAFIGTVVMVALMTYVLMPFITTALQGWLFKHKKG